MHGHKGHEIHKEVKCAAFLTCPSAACRGGRSTVLQLACTESRQLTATMGDKQNAAHLKCGDLVACDS